jgi:hypothetical protein
MCMKITRKEPNKRKVITAFKIFQIKLVGRVGLFPTFHYGPRTKSAERGKWIKSTHIGWHAYLSRSRAKVNKSGLNQFVSLKVRLRNIIGYNRKFWENEDSAVRALEMFIPREKRKR